MYNILTIDVEEWYKVTSFDGYIESDSNFSDRIEIGIDKTLHMLRKNSTKATFFILGTVAEKYPEIVRLVRDQGHEVASHGYSHRLVYQMKREEFAEDVKKSKEILEKITQQEVIGYRAPSGSITDEVSWVFEILKENSFLYDASLYPPKVRFGISWGKRFPFYPMNQIDIMEIPFSTFEVLGRFIPFCGGIYLRIWPYKIIRHMIQRINSLGQPAVVYIHNWELDMNQPRLKNIPLKNRLIHYYNLASTERKMAKLLEDFRFCTVSEYVKNFTQECRHG